MKNNIKNNFMTFNLKYDFTSEGKDSWNLRCKKILNVIEKNNPICIGTQEGLIHMLSSIEKNLKNYSYIGKGREKGGGGEHNAIFYRNDILEPIYWRQFWLSETPNIAGSKSWDTACERICTYCKFKNKLTNEEVILYNTHLDHESQLARVKGIELIIKTIKENYMREGIKFILMGDFNCYLDDEVFQIISKEKSKKFQIKNLYNEFNHNILGTFHDFKGGFEGGIIDYILVSKEIGCSNLYIDSRKIDDSYPSDHYALIGTLEL